jgi:hypothetical protein
MSTVQNQVVAPAAVAAPAEKKARKPTLSAKYSKFLVSNYSIIQMLQAKGLLSDEAVETAYTEIKLFNSVEDQSAFYESFLESSKATSKTMKKFVTQRLKPPKAPRAKKERKPKAEKPAAEAKVKKPRTKKETKVADDTKQDLVAQLVEAANAPMPPAEEAQNTPVQAVAEAKEAPGAPKKEKKPRAKKEAKVAAAAEDKPKEKKPRAKKVKEAPKPEPVVQAAAVEEEEEDEEIHTQEIKIGDDTYLIDGDNNLYSVETHEQVGTFNAETNQVVAV